MSVSGRMFGGNDDDEGNLSSLVSSPIHQYLKSLAIGSDVTVTSHAILSLRSCMNLTDLQITNVDDIDVEFDNIVSLCDSMKHLTRLTLHAKSFGNQIFVPSRLNELIPSIPNVQQLFLLGRREVNRDLLYHNAITVASLPKLQILTCDCIDPSAFHNQRRRLDLPNVQTKVNVRVLSR
jgi:hypothetical protein